MKKFFNLYYLYMNKKIIIVLILLALCGAGLFLIGPKKDTPQMTTTTTRYFGNETRRDLNGDGEEDRAYLITQDGGGSGLFYYAVVDIKTPTGYKTTNAFFIGDRIAPQSLYIPKNSMELQVNYAERNPGEPMTTKPSRGVTKLLKVTPEGVLEGLMK
jgi:hypothetical protein